MIRASQRQKPSKTGPSRSVDPNSEARLEQDARSASMQNGRKLSPRDFSGVRVHADTAANQYADRLGARAVTMERDIFFGTDQFKPATAEGQELMAHEMAHVAQQSTGAAAGPQFDDKKQKGGIGATPPEADFISDPDNWGAEDQFVLFQNDDAGLDATDEKTIRELVANQQQNEPLYIHVHGYASREGPGDYNLNLSAHRSVAVKSFVESLLPAGSKVVAFAHGESKHFGPGPKNRRVGISLMGTVSQRGFHLQLGSPFGSPAPAGQRFVLTTPPISPPPPTLPPVNTVKLPPDSIIKTQGPDPMFRSFPTVRVPLNLMAGADILAPFSLHGVSPGSRADIIGDWTNAYFVFRNYLPENLAAKAANSFLSAAYQAQLEQSDPNFIERSNVELKTRFPNETRTPIIPLLTPIEILTGKDLHTF